MNTDVTVLDALTEEYLATLEAGQDPDVEAMVARAGDDGSAFRRWVQAHRAVARVSRVLIPDETTTGRFEDYTELEVLGQGGLSTVYRARDKRLDRIVALKILEPASMPAKDTWLHEARALARVQHPHVVQVFDAGVAKGKPYLVMELVQGWPLDSLIAAFATAPQVLEPNLGELARRMRPEKERIRLAAKLASALQACHKEGILHRDLKPRNVIVTPEGEPKLLDFGLAHQDGLESSGEITQNLYGTAPYLAPEQIESGQTGGDVRTDLYALGTVIYELFALERPFTQESHPKLFEAIRFHSPNRIRGTGRQLNEVIAICLRKHPGDRYPEAHHVKDELERVLMSQPILGHGQSKRRRVRLWLARHRRAALAAVLLLAPMIALTIYSYSSYRETVGEIETLLAQLENPETSREDVMLQMEILLPREEGLDELDASVWNWTLQEPLGPRLANVLDALTLRFLKNPRGEGDRYTVVMDSDEQREIGSRIQRFSREFEHRSVVVASLESFTQVSITVPKRPGKLYLQQWVTIDDNRTFLSDLHPAEYIDDLHSSLTLPSNRKYRLSYLPDKDSEPFLEINLYLRSSLKKQICRIPDQVDLPLELEREGSLLLRERPDRENKVEFEVPAFYIDRDWVTVADFRRFLEQQREEKLPVEEFMIDTELPPPDAGMENQPCIVPWEAATAYASARGLRLPTQLELLLLSDRHPEWFKPQKAWHPFERRVAEAAGEWCDDGEPLFPGSHRMLRFDEVFPNKAANAADVYIKFVTGVNQTREPLKLMVVFRCARSLEPDPSIP